MKLTDKQKKFILNNLDLLDTDAMETIIENLIDNMDKDYATQLIGEMVETLKECLDCCNEVESCGDR